MIDLNPLALLGMLGHQSLWISGFVLALLALRPLLLKALGAGAVYTAWLGVPMALLALASPALQALEPTMVLRLKASALLQWQEQLPELQRLQQLTGSGGAEGWGGVLAPLSWLLALLWAAGLLGCCSAWSGCLFSTGSWWAN